MVIPCPYPDRDHSKQPAHRYIVQTQAEKYHTLTTMPLGVGALVAVQWVASGGSGTGPFTRTTTRRQQRWHHAHQRWARLLQTGKTAGQDVTFRVDLPIGIPPVL